MTFIKYDFTKHSTFKSFVHFFFQFLTFLGYYRLIQAVNYLLLASRSLHLTVEVIQLTQKIIKSFVDFFHFLSYQRVIKAVNYLIIAWSLLNFTLERIKLLKYWLIFYFLLLLLFFFWIFWIISTLLSANCLKIIDFDLRKHWTFKNFT